MRIFICDDSPRDLQQNGRLIQEITKKHDIEIELFSVSSGKELFFKLEDEKYPIDLIFLDISMPELTGIDVAKLLRAKKITSELVFLTVSTTHFLDAFDVEASNYVVKDDTLAQRLEDVFLKIHQKITLKKQKYVVFTGGGSYRNILIAQIRYFEVNKRIVTVHYDEDQSFEFFSSIAKLEERLYPYGFLRCHRSFLISKYEITHLTYTEVTLRNQMKLPVGRKYYQSLKDSVKDIEQV